MTPAPYFSNYSGESYSHLKIWGHTVTRPYILIFQKAFHTTFSLTRMQYAAVSHFFTLSHLFFHSIRHKIFHYNTKKSDDKVEIKVLDNGNGIPQHIIDKIFQPFFTTKPTGQGTGLGLSLSYDIIKAHGGEIKVETKEDEGTDFIIQLPIST